MRFLQFLILFFYSFSLLAVEVELIDKTQDRNFNGINRGIMVFQEILSDDYGAINEKGLIKTIGEFDPNEIVQELFQKKLTPYEGKVVARWGKGSKAIILDRGYINDGSENPRIPEKLQQVVDLYNSQIMGAVNSNKAYRLIIFSIDSNESNSNKKGWIIINTRTKEGLFAASIY